MNEKVENLDRRLVLISNDFPAKLVQQNGKWEVSSAPGGLVTALEPLAEKNGSLWVGWPGCSDLAPAEKLLREHSQQHNYELRGVMLNDRLIEGYYDGFCNRTLWPIFAYHPEHAYYKAEWWHAYTEANEKFANQVATEAREDDIIWVHDLQVMMTAKFLRDMGFSDTSLAFFLHTPFPPANIFKRVPWREQILRALLDFDLLGFHTSSDVDNFIWCLQDLLPHLDYERSGQYVRIKGAGRDSHLGDFPISMDFDQFESSANSEKGEKFARQIRSKHSEQTFILGTERLDYTKGIPEKLEAYNLLLKKYPELHGDVRLLQMMVPDRTNVDEYMEYKRRVEEMVGRINGKHGTEDWTPVTYFYHKVPFHELNGYYRAADICFVNSVIDGMNLVAKEYCAAQVDTSGVLVLSEFTGAENQLGDDALMVNPYNVEHTADTLKRAIDMSAEEREERMKRMRESVREKDVHWWRNKFLRSLRDLKPERTSKE